MALNKAFKRKWLAALRSGEYEQGGGVLVSGNKKTGFAFCCLGVAGALCGMTPAELRRMKCNSVINEAANSFLNDELTEKLGIPASIQEKLAGINDTCVTERRDGMADGVKPFAAVIRYISRNL